MMVKLVSLCSLAGALIFSGCGADGNETLPVAAAGREARKDPGINRKQGKAKPVTVIPFTDAEGAWWLAPGAPMYASAFAFDPSRRRAFPPDGPQISSADMPVPMRLASFNFASYGGSVSGEYANVIFDFSKAGDADRLPLGVIMVDEDLKQWPAILIQKSKRVLIDADYFVYPDNLEAVKPGGPFATLEVEVMAGRGDMKPVGGALVHIVKGGKRLGPFSTNPNGKVLVRLEDLLEPFVTVSVRSMRGSAEMPVPLPVRGADENVFIQDIPIRVE